MYNFWQKVWQHRINTTDGFSRRVLVLETCLTRDPFL